MVSIIISNFNGKNHLKKCLPSLVKLKLSKEIIVVDNGSTDGSVDFLVKKYPRVKIVRQSQNLGFAKANNLGAEIAKAKYLLFLNNDTVVPSNLLEVLLPYFKKEKRVGILQPKIYQMDSPQRLDVVASYLTSTGFLSHLGFNQKDQGQFDHLKYIFSPKGACMFMKKDLFFQLGQFDQDFFSYFEETDLAWRVWLSGHKVIFVPAVTIEHSVGATTKKLDFNFIQYNSFKNRLNTLIKNLSFPQLLWRLPTHLLILIVLSFFLILALRSKRAWAIFKAILWNLWKLPKTYQKRKFVQAKIRKVSDQKLITQISVPLDWKKHFWDVVWFWRGN